MSCNLLNLSDFGILRRFRQWSGTGGVSVRNGTFPAVSFKWLRDGLMLWLTGAGFRSRLDCRNHVQTVQGAGYGPVRKTIDEFRIRESHFQLGRMNIHIHGSGIDIKMQRRERILMRHGVRLIGVFDCPHQDGTSDIASVNKIILVITVSS